MFMTRRINPALNHSLHDEAVRLCINSTIDDIWLCNLVEFERNIANVVFTSEMNQLEWTPLGGRLGFNVLSESTNKVNALSDQ